MADTQSAGRGRLGRNWASLVGNLHTSGLVLLKAGDPAAATLALVAAVALFDAAAIWTSDIMLKWPNDLFAGEGKLAGILLERAGDRVVVGFGVNLRQSPEGLDRPVTSFADFGVAAPEPGLFLETLTQFFADWLSCWRGRGLASIRTAWLERAHPVGTALSVNVPDGEVISGLFDGLSQDCALRLRLADGQVRVIHAGDVFLT